MTNWPDDADGDVFRSLQADGCDFSKTYTIDFFVDFPDWPPAEEALSLLEANFGKIELVDEEEDETPCVLCKIESLLTYEFVTATQAKIAEAVKPFGGYCMDWGVQI